MNFLHNDIKTENILIGQGDRLVYLIDFGLAKPYMESKGGNHLPENVLTKFSGNFMFASKNQCEGYTNSRRSDIESAFYVLLYLLNKCKLPWSCLSSNTDKSYTELLIERTKKRYV